MPSILSTEPHLKVTHRGRAVATERNTVNSAPAEASTGRRRIKAFYPERAVVHAPAFVLVSAGERLPLSGCRRDVLAVTDREVALLRLGPGGVRNGRPGEVLARMPRSEVALARVSADCSLAVTSGCLLPRCLLDSV